VDGISKRQVRRPNFPSGRSVSRGTRGPARSYLASSDSDYIPREFERFYISVRFCAETKTADHQLNQFRLMAPRIKNNFGEGMNGEIRFSKKLFKSRLCQQRSRFTNLVRASMVLQSTYSSAYQK